MFNFALVFPDKRGNYHFKEVGTTSVAHNGPDDRVTLSAVRYFLLFIFLFFLSFFLSCVSAKIEFISHLCRGGGGGGSINDQFLWFNSV